MNKKEAKNINKQERTTRRGWKINSEENARKNKIYGNCRVYSPSGNLMFLCIEKKANWYLDRFNKETGEPLAMEILHINPVIRFIMKILDIKPRCKKIQLLFEPKQEGNKGDRYSLSRKDNKCVVTGSKNIEKLTKHHVTPYCYRKYLPDEYKSANSHDVVLIIGEAHYEYERYADGLKQELSKKHRAPIDGNETVNHKFFYAIKSAAALKNHLESMPKEVVESHKAKIREYTEKKSVTQKMIDTLSNTPYEEAKKIKSHGEIVVEKLMEKGDEAIQEFVEMWREHFIKYAKPKYMPKHWDVKRPASRKK